MRLKDLHCFQILLLCAVTVEGFAAESVPRCGPASAGRAISHLHGEVAKGERFSAPLTLAFGLTLEPVDAGWQLRIRDVAGLDLSAMTPPRFGPNPRDLYG